MSNRKRKLCPTPSKSDFETEEPAQATLDYILSGTHAALSAFVPERVYPCQCGRWHLTKKGEPDGRPSNYK